MTSASVREMSGMGIPNRYAAATFDDYRATSPSQESALSAARGLAAGDIGGLSLLGPPGVGKSHLLAAACEAIAQARTERYEQLLESYEQAHEEWREKPAAPEEIAPRHPTVPTLPRWCNVPSLIVDMRAEMSSPDHDHAERAHRLRDHRALVVLDDLGRERMSDWTGELVYAIVNARYEAMLPTAVASNLSPEELRDSGYWPAISRLAEGGRLVTIEAADHRLGASR